MNRFLYPLIVAASLGFCGVGMPLWAAESEPGLYSRQEGGLWVGGNGLLEIGIDMAHGTLDRLLDRISREDYCNQTVSPFSDDDATLTKSFPIGHRRGGVTLFDELKGQEFSDLSDNATVENWRVEESAGTISASFQKKFPDADFLVKESFRIFADHVRWDVKLMKTAGAPRNVRVIQYMPLPLGNFNGWAPISDAPFSDKPYLPFAIEYGQSTSGPVGEGRWRTCIPMMVFYSQERERALALSCPLEIPTVRTRFMNNTGAGADFHWNSRSYPSRERPYFQVSQEYLGLREKKEIETGLLISAHPADWRPALGWFYSKYREYFDPSPDFDPWDGVFTLGYELTKDSFQESELRRILAGRRQRGARWEELHGHFPWYGLMIPSLDLRNWTCESHPLEGATLTREKIAAHTRRNRDFGIGTFLYYNTTEAESWYAEKEFPESIAKDEGGEPLGAFRAERYPDKRACWLMNADPGSPFGGHVIRQAKQMVEAYPESAGFFWDVYGRGYLFDFAHDDGITMVNNKPAYYPEFMYQRLMEEYIRPLLRGHKMCVTANKPVTVRSCKGLDGIMAKEDAPNEDNPAWIAAQSYLGLNRHVMVFDGQSGMHAERLLLTCLRYGLFYSDLSRRDEKGNSLSSTQLALNEKLAEAYRPFIERFRGKQWIYHPRALELPRYTDGNIFRLKDGSVMVTVVSAWRSLRQAEGFDRNLQVICRLPDADRLNKIYISSIDLGDTLTTKPERNGDTLKIILSRHGKASVILLASGPDDGLEAAVRRSPTKK